MKRFIENHDGKEYDLIIVGGGVTGAAVAYDAATRSLSVALVEKSDFGCATSAATSKLIHGGFRYLVHGEFSIVRESLRERRTLENIAPNLVYPVRVLVPCYNRGMTKYTWAIKLGMLIFDALSYDKGRTWDKSKSIKPHTSFSPAQAAEIEPAISQEGLKKVFAYYDCSSLFPERLTLAFIKSAAANGADVSNYCKVENFIFSEGGKRISGVTVRDLPNDRSVEIKGKLVINCGGPWADIILGLASKKDSAHRIKRSEGIHIITKPICKSKSMIGLIPTTGKGFLLLPWRGHTLIGLTDKEYSGDPDDFKVTKTAIEELIADVNASRPGCEKITYSDVLHTYGGLRPLVEEKGKSARDSSRKYEIFDSASEGFDGLVTVEGGKYTTSRNLAQHVMQTVAKKLNLQRSECVTGKRHLAGCEIKDINKFIEDLKTQNKDFPENTIDTLGRYYGTEAPAVLELARQDKSLAEPLNADGEIPAQAVYAVREEMALTLKDILMRRTGAGALGHPGDAVINKLADIAAKELGWDDARKSKEITEAAELFKLPE